MTFKPTLKQALGLALIRGYSIEELVKTMSESEAKDFMIAVHLVKEKLQKDNSVKPMGQNIYDQNANARRKARNIETGANDDLPKTMNRVKQYGGSGPSAAVVAAKKMKQKSAKNPVKQIDPKTGEVVAVVHASGKKKGSPSMSKTLDQLQNILKRLRKTC